MSLLFVLAVVRVLAFAVVLTLLPRRLVPWSAVLALAVAVLFFSLPLAVGSGASGAIYTYLLSPNSDFNGTLLPSAMVAREIVVGMVLGAALGVPGVAAQLLARFVSLELFGKRAAVADGSKLVRPRAVGDLLICLFAAVFLQSGFAERLIFNVSRSMAQLPLGAAGDDSALFLLVKQGGELALNSALFLALPLFIAMLSVDAALIIENRYAPRLLGRDTTDAVRICALAVIVMLMVPFLLFGFRDQSRSAAAQGEGVLRREMPLPGAAGGSVSSQ